MNFRSTFLSASALIISSASLCVPVFAHAAVGDVPSTGLVGHWSFDENTGTNAADSSGNGYNATLVNSPTWVAGIAGSAVQFAKSWSRLSEQFFRVDKWNVCRG